MRLVLAGLIAVGMLTSAHAQDRNLANICFSTDLGTVLPNDSLRQILDSFDIRGSCDSVVVSAKYLNGVELPFVVPFMVVTKALPCTVKVDMLITSGDTAVSVCNTAISNYVRFPALHNPALGVFQSGTKSMEINHNLPPDLVGATITIFNSTGRQIKKFESVSGVGNLQWNTSGLTSGKYLIVLTTKVGAQVVPLTLMY